MKLDQCFGERMKLFLGLLFLICFNSLRGEPSEIQGLEKNPQIINTLTPTHHFDKRLDPNGQGSTTYFYNNVPPLRNFNNSSTIYTDEYAVPPPAYYLLDEEDGSTVWGKIKR